MEAEEEQMAPPASPAKKVHPGRWFAGGLAAGLLLAALGVCALLAGSSDLPGLVARTPLAGIVGPRALFDEDTRSGIDDATADVAALAEEMAKLEDDLSRAAANPASENYEGGLRAAREALSEALGGGRERIATDRKAIDGALGAIEGDELDDAVAERERLVFVSDAIAALDAAMAYERKMLDVQNSLGCVPAGSSAHAETPAYFQPAWDAATTFPSIDAPLPVADLHDRYVSLWDPFATYLYELHEGWSASPVELHSLREVLDWARQEEGRALHALHSALAQQYRYAAWMASGGADAESLPAVGWSAIEKVSPNLYPSLDSVLDLAIGTPVACTVTIEAQISGLTERLEVRRALDPGTTQVLLKPQLLADLDAAALADGRSAQLDFTVTSSDGVVLEQQSVAVEVLSLYDFNWRNDEFGTTSQLDLLSWLRPSQSQIDDINRRAAGYMGEWTDGLFAEIAGYQYGDDWYGTLLQVAAIQKALSDTGTTYVVDTYSPRADQRILTPSAALGKQQALCVETSLIVASALTSAGMHPYIVITPGHSQVAVEAWEGSGQYFLIETALLPYEGVDRALAIEDPDFYGGLVPYNEDGGGAFTTLDTVGSAEVWERFFASVEDDSDVYGGVYVIDCNLQRTFSFYGLDSM